MRLGTPTRGNTKQDRRVFPDKLTPWHTFPRECRQFLNSAANINNFGQKQLFNSKVWVAGYAALVTASPICSEDQTRLWDHDVLETPVQRVLANLCETLDEKI
jgi:hypothetical protein